MATIPRNSWRQLKVSLQQAQSSYICPSCRNQPSMRHSRQITSSSRRRAAQTTEVDVSKLGSDSKKAPVATLSSPDSDPNYVPATTWEGLDRVGSKAWIRRSGDPGDSFEGWSRRGRAEITAANIDEIMSKIESATFEGQGGTGSTQHITDHATRLKLLASVAEITGVRLPDFQAQKLRSVADVRHLLLAKPKSTLFSQVGKDKFSATPNVQIHETRRTRVHKEQEKGKWKLIEEGLRQRGLPVWGKDVTAKRNLL